MIVVLLLQKLNLGMVSILILVKIAPEIENFPTFFTCRGIVKYNLWFYRNTDLIKRKDPYCLIYLTE